MYRSSSFVGVDSLPGRYLAHLGTKDEAVRVRAAKNLRIHVDAEAREMSGATFSKFIDDLSNRIYDLITSRNQYECLGGICAMDELIDVHTSSGEDNEVKNMRFVNFLRVIFQSHTKSSGRVEEGQHAIIVGATRTLGHIARAGGTLNNADLVEYELKRSFEWLQGDPRDEYHRFAAVLILKELACNAPVLFRNHIDQFFDHIWVAIQDRHSEVIREGAISALRAVFQLMVQRDPAGVRSKWCQLLWSKTRLGLHSSDPAVLHGSLLTLGELLKQSSQGDSFMSDHFQEAAELVFGFRNSKHGIVQKSLTGVLPVLASFDPAAFFQGGFLPRSMEYLLGRMRLGIAEVRGPAFTAVGDIASALMSDIAPFVDSIVPFVQDALKPSRSASRKTETAQALVCISRLVKAMGPAFRPHIESLIEHMFAGGLTEGLLATLHQLVDSIPSMLRVIQNRLLKCISGILSTPAFEQNGLGPTAPYPVPELTGSTHESVVILALSALGEFGVDDPGAKTFVVECVFRFLEHQNAEVRKAAALTICRLTFPRPSPCVTCPGLSNYQEWLPSERFEETNSFSSVGTAYSTRPSNFGRYSVSAQREPDSPSTETLYSRIEGSQQIQQNQQGLHQDLNVSLKQGRRPYLDNMNGPISLTAPFVDPPAIENLSLYYSSASQQSGVDGSSGESSLFHTTKLNRFSSSSSSLVPQGHPGDIGMNNLSDLELRARHDRQIFDLVYPQSNSIPAFSKNESSRAPVSISSSIRPSPSVENVHLIRNLRATEHDQSSKSILSMSQLSWTRDDGTLHPHWRREIPMIPRRRTSIHYHIRIDRVQLFEILRTTQRLCTFAVREPEASVRQAALEAFDIRFDPFLCDPICVAALAQALHDENFHVRKVVVGLAGRLSHHQPLSVMHGLNKLLVQLLTELEYGHEQWIREESVEVLGDLIVSAANLMAPFAKAIFVQLIKKLKDVHSGLWSDAGSSTGAAFMGLRDGVATGTSDRSTQLHVVDSSNALLDSRTTARKRTIQGEAGAAATTTSPLLQKAVQGSSSSSSTVGSSGAYSDSSFIAATLKTLGQLLVVAESDSIKPFLHELSSILVLYVQDTTGRVKRESALYALSQLVKKTGYVVYPYTDYPSLLPYLISVLRTQVQQNYVVLRREVIRAIGTIGALDPAQYSKILAQKNATKEIDRLGKKVDCGVNAQVAVVTMPSHSPRHPSTIFAANTNRCSADKSSGKGIDIFTRKAVTALLQVVRDPALAEKHLLAAQGLFYIFKSLERNCARCLPHVMPSFFNLLRTSDSRDRESLLTNIADLIAITGGSAQKCIHEIYDILKDLMDKILATLCMQSAAAAAASANLQSAVHYSTSTTTPCVPLTCRTGLSGQSQSPRSHPAPIPRDGVVTGRVVNPPASSRLGREAKKELFAVMRVLEELSAHISVGFEAQTNWLLSILISLVQGDTSSDAEIAIRILQSIQKFGRTIQDNVFLILPPLARLCESDDIALPLRLSAAKTISHLTMVCQFPLLVGHLVHPMARVLDAAAQPMVLKLQLIETLHTIYLAFGPDVAPFLPLIRSICARNRLSVPPIFEGTPTFSFRDHMNFLGSDSPRDATSMRSSASDASAPLSGNQTGIQNKEFEGNPGASGSETTSLTGGPRDVASSIPLVASPLTVGNPKASASSKNGATTVAIKESANCSKSLTGSMTGDGTDITILNTVQQFGNAPTGQYRAGVEGSTILQVNEFNLKQAWEQCTCSTRDEWEQWLQRLGLELIKESSSPAIRACLSVAQTVPPIVRKLFPVAFLSCWQHLNDNSQYDLARCALCKALSSPSMSPSDLQQILNLAEFMEHHGESLPIDCGLLARVAEKCHAYAKALHYKEQEWLTNPEPCVEALISLNNQLQQSEAAEGILIYAQKHLNVTVKESWYEKLNRWEDALEAYEERQLDDPDSIEWVKGRMRCLHSLGEWERLSSMCDTIRGENGEEPHPGLQDSARRFDIARLAAAAEFNLRNWDRMEKYVAELQREDCAAARYCIQRARELLDPELTALVSESYTRAYTALVKVQQMIEMDEIIEYKMTADSQARTAMEEMWTNRLQGCQPNVDMWQAILRVRAMVLPPCKSILIWLKFASLCRKQNRLSLSVKIVSEMRENINTVHDPRVTMAHLKNLYAAGRRREAQQLLRGFCQHYSTFFLPDVKTCILEQVPLTEALSFYSRISARDGIRGTTSGPLHRVECERREGEGKFVRATFYRRKCKITEASTVVAIPSHMRLNLIFFHSANASETVSAATVALSDPEAAWGNLATFSCGQWNVGAAATMTKVELLKLLSKCHLKLGIWTKELFEEQFGPTCWLLESRIGKVLSWLQSSIHLNDMNYKAWNAWALTNFQLVQRLPCECRSTRVRSLLVLQFAQAPFNGILNIGTLFPQWMDIRVLRDSFLSQAVESSQPHRECRQMGHLAGENAQRNACSHWKKDDTRIVCQKHPATDWPHSPVMHGSSDTKVQFPWQLSAGAPPKSPPLASQRSHSSGCGSGCGLYRSDTCASSGNGILTSSKYASGGMNVTTESDFSFLKSAPRLPVDHKANRDERYNKKDDASNDTASTSTSRIEVEAGLGFRRGVTGNKAESDKVLTEVAHFHPFSRKQEVIQEKIDRKSITESSVNCGGLERMLSDGNADNGLPVPSNYGLDLYSNHLHFVVEAVRGFLRTVALRPANANLQDVLRLLTLWFGHSSVPELELVLREGLETCPVLTWLDVIPQLLARLSSPNECLRRMLKLLLAKIGKDYPQALVFPLTVASKSSIKDLAKGAAALVDDMQTHSPVLVQQSLLASDELMRVSILWIEQWRRGLEEASRMYHTCNNCDGMVNTLLPLHEMILEGAASDSEVSFVQTFGQDLNFAYHWIDRYQKTRHKHDLDQAWQYYYKVFARIIKQIYGMKHLDLQHVSPCLCAAQDLELAVPGKYQPDYPFPKIKGFTSRIDVFKSKQKPRKIQIEGSDGFKYKFLLKGQEDLRQDERVMQILGLINHLLDTNAEARRKNLFVPRFSVIPLSTNTGLIEWVEDCDTMHNLIKQYREAHHIPLSLENNLMKSFYSNCEDLTILQKVEVFQYALSNSSGEDLRRVLWLQSRSSEVWLSRRTNYSRSFAMMSMVGYILGLGDRHPSNLLLLRGTGRVVHIDFGDCFEVATFRQRFPEKIPFRLTRMLLNAMEVSGVEGNFRFTCELVMRVLRHNKDTVMAMLEAFVYDPLITWRLLLPHRKRLQQLKGKGAVTMASSGSIFGSPRHLDSSGSTMTTPPAFDSCDGSFICTEKSRSSSSTHVQKIVRHDGSGRVQVFPVKVGDSSFVTNALRNALQRSQIRPVFEKHDQHEDSKMRAALKVGAHLDPSVRDTASASGDHLGSIGVGANSGRKPLKRRAVVEENEFEDDEHTTMKETRERELRQEEQDFDKIDPILLSSCARIVIQRVDRKLTGMDFELVLNVAAQVDRLINEATSQENLCQCYVGWCPFW